eukprot:51022_1
MSYSIENLKLHHENTKAIVLHFIKQSQQRLFKDKGCSYYNIPEIVAAITSLYVVHHEYFTSYGAFLRPSNQIHICTVQSNGSHPKRGIGYNTVYGNIKVDNMNTEITWYRWTFKVQRDLYYRGGFGIGIDSSPQQFVGCVYYNKRYNPNSFYALQFGLSATAKFSQNDTNSKYAQCQYQQNTIITMEVNVKHKSITYYFDGADQGIAFGDIDLDNNRKYFMALVLDHTTVIQLIDFCQK